MTNSPLDFKSESPIFQHPVKTDSFGFCPKNKLAVSFPTAQFHPIPPITPIPPLGCLRSGSSIKSHGASRLIRPTHPVTGLGRGRPMSSIPSPILPSTSSFTPNTGINVRKTFEEPEFNFPMLSQNCKKASPIEPDLFPLSLGSPDGFPNRRPKPKIDVGTVQERAPLRRPNRHFALETQDQKQYFCHQCKQDLVEVNPNLTCPLCLGDFIEESNSVERPSMAGSLDQNGNIQDEKFASKTNIEFYNVFRSSCCL